MRGNDVEPVDLEPLDVADHRPPQRPLHVSRRWVAIVSALVLAWIGLAVVTRGNHDNHAAATPITYPRTDVTVIPAFTAHALPSSFVNGLSFVGRRFAVNTGNHLFLVAGHESHDVTFAEPLAGVSATSGTDLLVRLQDRSVIVRTGAFPGRPITEQEVPPHESAIPAVEAGHWWYVREDNVLQYDGTGERRFPPNLRILAAVDGGFVALDTAAQTYVVWNGSISHPLVPENSALLATTPRLIAFARDCVEQGCTLEIDDASTGRAVLVEPVQEVYRSATFSPSAKSLAAVSTDGRVTIVDVRSGVSLEEDSRSIGTLNAGMPVSWVDENTLLVVEHLDVRLAPTSNRLPVRGIQQVVALP